MSDELFSVISLAPIPAFDPVVENSSVLTATPTGLCKLSKKGLQQCFCNFRIRVDARVCEQQKKFFTEKILLLLTCGNTAFSAQIRSDALERAAALILRHCPCCTLNPGQPNGARVLSAHLRELVSRTTAFSVISEAGWYDLPGGPVYVHDGLPAVNPMIRFSTGRQILVKPGLSPQAAFQESLGFTNLFFKEGPGLTLLLFSYLGPLQRFLEKMQHPAKFLLFLSGRTGTMKTSIASLAFRIFDTAPIIPASFNDSAAAIAEKASETSDQVFWVDDFHPTQASKDDRILQERLEVVTRLYGDRESRSRCGGRGGLQPPKCPGGVCAITGEMLSGSESTLLRYWFLPLEPGDIRDEILSRYQNDPALLTSNLAFFLDWLGRACMTGLLPEWQQIVASREQCLRKGALPGRPADACAGMQSIAWLLIRYGVTIAAISQQVATPLLEQFYALLERSAQQSALLAQQANPVWMFLEALYTSMQSQSLRIAPTPDAYQSAMESFDGYMTAGELFLLPGKVYDLVRRYWGQQGKRFPLSLISINQLLRSEKLSRGLENTNLVRSSFGTRPYMLALDLQELKRRFACIENEFRFLNPVNFRA